MLILYFIMDVIINLYPKLKNKHELEQESNLDVNKYFIHNIIHYGIQSAVSKNITYYINTHTYQYLVLCLHKHLKTIFITDRNTFNQTVSTQSQWLKKTPPMWFWQLNMFKAKILKMLHKRYCIYMFRGQQHL